MDQRLGDGHRLNFHAISRDCLKEREICGVKLLIEWKMLHSAISCREIQQKSRTHKPPSDAISQKGVSFKKSAL